MSKIFCVLLGVLLLSACTQTANEQGISSSQSIPQSQTQPIKPLMDCIYYDREMFTKAVTFPQKYTVDGELMGGMIPHHLLVADMISGFFAMAAQQEQTYDTVLIVSPSHFPENCKSDVVTSVSSWDTPFGILETDEELTNKILENKIINAENSFANIRYDHGVSGAIPFIKHYLPDVKIAVCLLSNTLSTERLGEVQRLIEEESKSKNILLVASADCSHYLKIDEAAKRDEETAQAIESFDLQKIMRFTDSNVDSPQSVTTLLSAVKSKEGSLVRLGHGSSPDKLPHSPSNPIYDEGITTYFVYGAVR